MPWSCRTTDTPDPSIDVHDDGCPHVNSVTCDRGRTSQGDEPFVLDPVPTARTHQPHSALDGVASGVPVAEELGVDLVSCSGTSCFFAYMRTVMDVQASSPASRWSNAAGPAS